MVTSGNEPKRAWVMGTLYKRLVHVFVYTFCVVVRLEGTNVEAGRKILGDSGLAITAADDMLDAAKKVVAAAGGAS